MTDRTFTRLLGTFAAVMVAFCIFGMFMSIKYSHDYAEACKAVGGVPFQAKHARICLNPEAVK